MLEVVLPFLIMKDGDEAGGSNTKIKQTSQKFDLACVYAYFKRFIRSFIPNNLHTKFNGRNNLLPHLRSSLHLMALVLAYSDKELV